jgi:hypothetical protein
MKQIPLELSTESCYLPPSLIVLMFIGTWNKELVSNYLCVSVKIIPFPSIP